jgi:hypothetical protein
LGLEEHPASYCVRAGYSQVAKQKLGVFGDVAANNDQPSPKKGHLKIKKKIAATAVVWTAHLALARDRQCHHAVTQWRQSLRLPAAGCWYVLPFPAVPLCGGA